ncbi:MAG TPA: DUF6311 domain-containing protein [Dyella sp.]|uniref:DUF6311 domain-containing protein n=1 Tax=Dyella sp. TaxID=1869338 RepID=UPI002D77F6F0|nr:DUF6311 domain-containing protein [Dyella sp.]HET6552674.1 DUF6311 domain-containing protein [Dyella sp.]
MLSNRDARQRWTLCLPLILGALAALFVTGGAMLSPGNVLWLHHADLAQSYLGWAFYRHDAWMLPWGATPSYGLEIHSSVYYSDSIPLLAMVLKPLASMLPEPFQYFGLWIVACFMLQGWFAWKIMSLATDNVFARILGCVLFVLSPPMLARLGGHMALVAHWVILAAMYLCLRSSSSRQHLWWSLLVPMAMLVHAYLFLMAAALWLADLAHRTWQARDIDQARVTWWRRALLEAAHVTALTLAVAWLAGFFMVPGRGMQAEGFGYYKMNLLAPFNGDGWSAFGLRFAEAAGEYEGFNYFGVGGLFLLFAGLLAAWRTPAHVRLRLHVPLICTSVLLALVAITPHVGLAGHQWQLPLPAWLQDKLSHSSIQATGRLFWLAYYALLAVAILALARWLPARWLTCVLAMAVMLQAVDLAPGLRNLNAVLTARATTDDAVHLQGPFWDEAGQRYRRLRLVPTRVLAPGWEVLARFALEHRMATDAIQVARANWKVFNHVRTEQLQRVSEGRPEPDTLYVLDPSVADRAARAARADDAVFILDGWRVLAPGWGQPLPAGAQDLKHAQ